MTYTATKQTLLTLHRERVATWRRTEKTEPPVLDLSAVVVQNGKTELRLLRTRKLQDWLRAFPEKDFDLAVELKPGAIHFRTSVGRRDSTLILADCDSVTGGECGAKGKRIHAQLNLAEPLVLMEGPSFRELIVPPTDSPEAAAVRATLGKEPAPEPAAVSPQPSAQPAPAPATKPPFNPVIVIPVGFKSPPALVGRRSRGALSPSRPPLPKARRSLAPPPTASSLHP